ncbi:MAG: hypothetical protein V5B38_06195 [Candidatus Accumulibacter propinquus]|jgi:hypothetical protein
MPSLSSRSLASLAQLLELLGEPFVAILFEKHGHHLPSSGGAVLLAAHSVLRDGGDSPGVFSMLEEAVRTNGDLRNRVTPRYRFDERYEDLSRCLLLDGYKVEGKVLTPLDPSIADAPPIEDELTKTLQATDLDANRAIAGKLTDSADAFRRVPPDHNACLNNARVALESLAREIARHVSTSPSSAYDPAKWGSILGFLRSQEFLSVEEEQGLAGVYRFLSPGSHRPLGLTDAEASRLGRSLALSMSWYLVKRYLARS